MFTLLWWLLLLFLLGVSCSDRQKGLNFGDGTFISDFELKYMGNAALPYLQLDPFCLTMLKEFLSFDEYDCDNPMLKDYFDFIFDGFEHSMNRFNEDASWEVLFNKSFHQYAQIPENKSKAEYILNETVIPNFPILKIVDYEANIEKLVDFGKASIKTFIDVLKGSVRNVIKYKVLIYSAIKALKQRDPTLIPYGYFVLNAPIELVKKVSIASTKTTDFVDFFLQAAEKIFNQVSWSDSKKRNALLSDIVPEEVSEGRPSGTGFHETMKYYGNVDEYLFIETDPLSNYLIQSIENDDLESISLIGNVISEFHREHVLEILHSAIKKGNVRVIDFVMRQTSHDILKNAVHDAIGYDQKDILEFLMKSERGAAKHFAFGTVFFDCIDLGYFDLAEDIVSDNYGIVVDKKVLPKLIESGRDELVERILPLLDLKMEDARDMFVKAAGCGNIRLMYLIAEKYEIDISRSYVMETVISKDQVKVAKEIIHLYKREYVVWLAETSRSSEMREFLVNRIKQMDN